MAYSSVVVSSAMWLLAASLKQAVDDVGIEFGTFHSLMQLAIQGDFRGRFKGLGNRNIQSIEETDHRALILVNVFVRACGGCERTDKIRSVIFLCSSRKSARREILCFGNASSSRRMTSGGVRARKSLGEHLAVLVVRFVLDGFRPAGDVVVAKMQRGETHGGGFVGDFRAELARPAARRNFPSASRAYSSRSTS